MTHGRALPEPVVRAMGAAERLLGEPIGLDDLARAAGLSRFHFHRVFRQSVGEPAGAFVERLRLERAALSLLAAEIPITELAWEVGFRNPETFARRFRARFDVSARDYRRHQLDLWQRLGLAAGRDPGGPGGPIEIDELPALEIAFERTIPPLGDDDGFAFDPTAAPWAALAQVSPVFVGRTLDAPGITPPGQLRIDRGVVIDGARATPGLCRGRLARGPHAIVTVPGRGPAPPLVYQRLFVWALGGPYRLAPGPIVEIYHENKVLVCQPVREHFGGAAWFPSSASRSTSR
jgi:AraC-like DNA-binding protein